MTKKLRSFIQERFTPEFRVQMELISRRRDVTLNEKQDLITKTLKDFKIDNVVSLGSGTNRYAFKLDGFVVKVATDSEGKLDNLNEFKMTKILPLDIITRSYEVSSNGGLLIAEYAAVFVSYPDFYTKREIVEEKLERLNRMGFLVGDVGITDKNYTNWGLRVGSNEPVILDYAYTYDVNSEQLICQKCTAGVLLNPTSDYSKLKCPACNQITLFQDLRRRIGTQEHINRIGDLSEIGYLMKEPTEEKTLDSDRSFYLRRKKHSEIVNSIFEEPVQDESDPFVVKEDTRMSWTRKVANQSSDRPVRIISSRLTARPASADTPRKYKGPQIVSSAEAAPTDYPLHEVSTSSVHFEDQDEPYEVDTTPKEETEKSEEDNPQMDGLLDVRVMTTPEGRMITNVKIGDMSFPIYGQILRNAEKYDVFSDPIDFSFFRHFRPTNYFITDTPEEFEGVGDCDKSIVFVKFCKRKEGTLFGLYGIGSMYRVMNDGTEISFNEANREKFIKALGLAINSTFDDEQEITLSRYEMNKNIPERALTPIVFIRDMCEQNGIKLNPVKSHSEESDDNELEEVGADVLSDLFSQTEVMANRDDPSHSDYVASDEVDEHDLDEEEVVEGVAPSIPVLKPVSNKSSFYANPAGSSVVINPILPD